MDHLDLLCRIGRVAAIYFETFPFGYILTNFAQI
jgi:hypothetical protein